jgi:hypothetical protein
MTLKKRQNPDPKVIEAQNTSTPLPPRELRRPRNGLRTGNALGIDKFSGPSGGGKCPQHFRPLVDRTAVDTD